MNEPQTQATEASADETPDTARKTWVAPTFERTPLNEAMSGSSTNFNGDQITGYS